MVIKIFDEDYIIKAHELEIKKEGAIKATIEMLQEEGYSYEDIVEKIVKKIQAVP